MFKETLSAPEDPKYYIVGSAKKPDTNFEKTDPIKEKVLGILKEEGILSNDNFENYSVFDSEKFFNSGFISRFQHKHLGSGKSVDKKPGEQVFGCNRLLFEKLADMKVVLKKDYDKAEDEDIEIEEIPLFNIPESIDEALDPERMNYKKYHYNFWNLYDHKVKSHINWGYKIKAKNGEIVSARELALATGLYRDHDAKRGQDGKLLVFDEEKDDFVKITSEWVEKSIGELGSRRFSVSLVESPQRFLMDYCPNLLKKNLVNLADFNIVTTGPSGELLRKEFTPKGAPYLMINGVKYYIGRDNFIFNKEKIPLENLKIVILDKNTAGIVEIDKGREVLKFTFKLLDENEKELKRQKISEKNPDLKPKEITARTFLNKKEMQKRISVWRPTSDNPKRREETAEAYAERIRVIGEFGFIKRVSDDFVKNTHLGIHNLSWREQQWLCGAAGELGKDYPRLLDFGKKYGLSGLRTFLSCELNMANAKKILSLDDNLPQGLAGGIFKKYSEIIDLAQESEEAIRARFKEQNQGADISRLEIAQGLLKRGQDLLAIISDKGAKAKLDEKEILYLLAEYKEDLLLDASIFKSLKGEISPEDLKGVEFKKVTVKELVADEKILEVVSQMASRELKSPVLPASFMKGLAYEFAKFLNQTEAENAGQIAQMLNIYSQNYSHKPKLQKKLVESFIETLRAGSDKTMIYFYKKDGEIIAFDRFDNQEGGKKYFGSFNVAPVIRGSAIGNALMEASLRKEAQENDIEAVSDPETAICSKYIEDEGFIVDKILPDYEGTGETIFNIFRGRQPGNFHYKVKDYPEEKIIQEYEAAFANNAYKQNDPAILLKFKAGSPELFETSQRLINNEDYLMTRYFFAGPNNEEVYCVLERGSK